MEKYPKEVHLKSGEVIVLNPLQEDEMECCNTSDSSGCRRDSNGRDDDVKRDVMNDDVSKQGDTPTNTSSLIPD